MTRKVFKLTEHIKHPGVLVSKYYLPSLGIEKDQSRVLSRLTGVPRDYAASFLKGKVSISDINTVDFAYELSRVFRTSKRFWKLLQELYDESEKKEGDDRKIIQTEGADRESFPR